VRIEFIDIEDTGDVNNHLGLAAKLSFNSLDISFVKSIVSKKKKFDDDGKK
jgi:hypothetical protein